MVKVFGYRDKDGECWLWGFDGDYTILGNKDMNDDFASHWREKTKKKKKKKSKRKRYAYISIILFLVANIGVQACNWVGVLHRILLHTLLTVMKMSNNGEPAATHLSALLFSLATFQPGLSCRVLCADADVANYSLSDSWFYVALRFCPIPYMHSRLCTAKKIMYLLWNI